MILTISGQSGKHGEYRGIDVMIKPEQRIQEVYRELLKNGYFEPVGHEGQIRVMTNLHPNLLKSTLRPARLSLKQWLIMLKRLRRALSLTRPTPLA